MLVLCVSQRNMPYIWTDLTYLTMANTERILVEKIWKQQSIFFKNSKYVNHFCLYVEQMSLDM